MCVLCSMPALLHIRPKVTLTCTVQASEGPWASSAYFCCIGSSHDGRYDYKSTLGLHAPRGKRLARQGSCGSAAVLQWDIAGPLLSGS